MRVNVDPVRCQDHTLCAMTAPEPFELDDIDGHPHAVIEEVAVMIDHVIAARAAHGGRLEAGRP